MRGYRSGLVVAQVLVSLGALGACHDDDPARSDAPDTAVTSGDVAAGSDAQSTDGTPSTGDATSDHDVGEVPLGPVLDDGCNPLRAGGDCLLPYPSDVFLVDDPSLPSGRRVQLTPESLPTASDDTPIDITHFWKDDGWSHVPTLLVFFPESVAAKHLVPYGSDLTASIANDSETLILDAETGERILHVAELDTRPSEDSDRLFILRPQVRLKNQHRYVVAIRDLTSPAGAAVAPPEAFAAVRDGKATPGTAAHRLMLRYDTDVFPVLEAAGVARGSLQLAWDFTTRSQENATHDLKRIRELALAELEATPPPVTITQVEENPNAEARRIVRGTLQVPRYITQDAAGAHLFRDASGEVVQNGTATVPFVIVIPNGLAVGQPARALQYGHGFFGDLSETTGGYVRGFAQEKKFVVFGVEWWGMDTTDRTQVALALNGSPADTLSFVERLHQGFVNQLALTKAIQTTLSKLPEVMLDDERVYEPSTVYYYGISQGHILGGTFMALSPVISRGVLGVGGGGFSHMMMRSSNFAPFLLIMMTHANTMTEQAKFVALTQQSCDRFDPITWAPHVFADPLPNRPADMRLLLQTGLGDPQVPNMTARLHARALDLPLLSPAVEVPPGFTEEDAPTSAFVEFDFGVASPRPGDLPVPVVGSDNPVHEGVRRTAAAKAQIDAFLRPDGTIPHTCDGPCDPE